MEDKLIICPKCGGNAAYEQQVADTVTTYFCFGCGSSTSTLMTEGSNIVTETLANSPELYKDLMFVDEQSRVWFPSTVTLPGKGMVFVDGTSVENWQWSAVTAIEISEEEKVNFPQGQTHKMDMKNAKLFGQKDFMDALEAIKFFEVEVGE